MKEDKRTILLTGATGLVGSYLLKILLKNNHKVFVLARSKVGKSAKERVVEVLNFWDKGIYPKHWKNLIVLEGDITDKNLGFTDKDLTKLKNKVEEVFHCAALTKLNSSLDELRNINVKGTQNLLNFVQGVKKIDKINFVSSAFVCGNYLGEFNEQSIDVGQGFITPYEQSKFEAEKEIICYRTKFPINIYRPSAILGETQTGKVLNFNQIFYQVMRMLAQNIFSIFPVKDAYVNTVPVDEVANSIYLISQISVRNSNFHIFAKPISLEKIVNFLFEYLNTSGPKIISRKRINNYPLSSTQKEILKKTIFSFNSGGLVNSDATQVFLKKLKFSFSNLDKNYFFAQFRFLEQSKFIKKYDI